MYRLVMGFKGSVCKHGLSLFSRSVVLSLLVIKRSSGSNTVSNYDDRVFAAFCSHWIETLMLPWCLDGWEISQEIKLLFDTVRMHSYRKKHDSSSRFLYLWRNNVMYKQHCDSTLRLPTLIFHTHGMIHRNIHYTYCTRYKIITCFLILLVRVDPLIQEYLSVHNYLISRQANESPHLQKINLSVIIHWSVWITQWTVRFSNLFWLL